MVLILGTISVFGVGTESLAFLAVEVLVLTITWNGIRVGGGAFGDAFMALAFAAVVSDAIVRKRYVPMPPWLCLAGVAFLFAALLTVMFPPATALVQKTVLTETNFLLQDGVVGFAAPPRSDISAWIKFEASLVLIPVLIAAVGTTPARCRRLIDLWTLSGVINAAVAIADYGGFHFTPVAFSANRSAGLTVQSNYLALTCVIAIPTALLWLGRSRRWTRAGVLSVLLLLGGTYASGSRDGSVTAVIALVLTVALIPRLRAQLYAVLPIAGAALVALLRLTSTGHQILKQVRIGGNGIATSLSDSQRSAAASVAWSQFQGRPLEGMGFSVIADAHDIYLELLASGGVLALAGFLAFCAGLASATRRALAGPQSEAAIALAVAVVVWLVNGVFDNQVADKYLYVVPGLLLAVSRARAVPATEPPPGTFGRVPARLQAPAVTGSAVVAVGDQ
jgi:hypothetical protein